MNVLTCGNKMNKLNANGDGKNLLFTIGGFFQILLIIARKFGRDSQDFSVIPRGDESSV